MKPRIGSLCTGFGGLDMAVIDALGGGDVAWHAQYEPPDKNGKPDTHQHAAQILAHRFPGVPNHGDITAIDFTAVEPVDVLTAGFPCTDISLAGKQAGLRAGTRSGIWAHVARAIAELRPSLVAIENVRSLTSASADSDMEPCAWCLGDGGDESVLRALGAVLGDLADLGFDAEWCTLRASDVGAPHRRDRIFIIAWPAAEDADGAARDQRRLATSGQAQSGRARPNARGRGGAPAVSNADGNALWEQPVAIAQRGSQAIAGIVGAKAASDADGATSRQNGNGQPAQQKTDHGRHRMDPSGRFLGWGPYGPAVARWEHALGRLAPPPVDERGRLNPVFVEWMIGLPAGWVTDVPGIPRDAQLKALGNGVVPQQGAAAFRSLLASAGFGFAGLERAA